MASTRVKFEIERFLAQVISYVYMFVLIGQYLASISQITNLKTIYTLMLSWHVSSRSIDIKSYIFQGEINFRILLKNLGSPFRISRMEKK